MSLFIIALLIVALLTWSNLWVRWVLPQISAEMTTDSTSIAHGEAFNVHITIRNTARLPAPYVHCEVLLPQGLSLVPLDEATDQNKPLAVALSLKSREVVTVTFRLYGIRRGVHRLHEFRIKLSDGWTPKRHDLTLQFYRQITVHPALISHTGTAERDPQPLGTVTRMRKWYATSLDWVDMRPYQPGDSLRDVAWRTTARRGELIVLERADTQTPDALVIVNVQTQATYHLGTTIATVDEVLEDGYWLTRELLQNGARVSLYTNAIQYGKKKSAHPRFLTITGPLAKATDHKLGHALGQLSPYAFFSFARLIEIARLTERTPTRVIVVTAYEDADSARQLAELRKMGHTVAVHHLTDAGAAEEVAQ
ncbi:MAG: DUF58 domain-containing protein [Firmicutes bacterium]|nr:DUF58 domain-containing protein [Bacillota bacterium]